MTRAKQQRPLADAVHRLLAVALAISSVVLAVGCGNKVDGCSKDSDCKGSRVCVRGTCRVDDDDDRPAHKSATASSQPTEQASKDPTHNFGEFIQENDALAASVKAAKTPEESKRAWGAHKERLKSVFLLIKDVRGFQVPEETTSKFEASVTACATTLCDPTLAGFDMDVCKDYGELFK
jgi:hypothetical protein